MWGYLHSAAPAEIARVTTSETITWHAPCPCDRQPAHDAVWTQRPGVITDPELQQATGLIRRIAPVPVCMLDAA